MSARGASGEAFAANAAMQRSVSVPFLPGHAVKPELGRTNHRKPQTLIYKLDCAVDKLAPDKLSLDPELIKSMSVKSMRSTKVPARF